MELNYFTSLNSINVNDKVEKKNGLTYLSWAYAWGEVKKMYPDANYVIYKNKDDWNYFTDGKTCWVEVSVTINNIEHKEHLPIMNYRNQSIKLDDVTSMDVCKSIQRALTKACARHGLGLYIYAGEDLPEANTGSIIEEIADAQEKASLITLINSCKSEDELGDLYKKHKKEICDNDNLLNAVTIKGKSLKGAA